MAEGEKDAKRRKIFSGSPDEMVGSQAHERLRSILSQVNPQVAIPEFQRLQTLGAKGSDTALQVLCLLGISRRQAHGSALEMLVSRLVKKAAQLSQPLCLQLLDKAFPLINQQELLPVSVAALMRLATLNASKTSPRHNHTQARSGPLWQSSTAVVPDKYVAGLAQLGEAVRNALPLQLQRAVWEKHTALWRAKLKPLLRECVSSPTTWLTTPRCLFLCSARFPTSKKITSPMPRYKRAHSAASASFESRLQQGHFTGWGSWGRRCSAARERMNDVSLQAILSLLGTSKLL